MADDDPRLITWCRMGLLAGAALHWIAAALLLWQKVQADRLPTHFLTLC